jgi:hypothetical protein
MPERTPENGWESTPEEIEITEKQYAESAEYVESGPTAEDLEKVLAAAKRANLSKEEIKQMMSRE